MKASILRQLKARKRKIEKRLAQANRDKYQRAAEQAGPVLDPPGVKYELASKVRGIAYGGVGMMLKLAQKVGLVQAIDQRLHLLKVHVPYHESDHVLNIAFNALCDATCLQDIELRRNDEVFLDALGLAWNIRLPSERAIAQKRGAASDSSKMNVPNAPTLVQQCGATIGFVVMAGRTR